MNQELEYVRAQLKRRTGQLLIVATCAKVSRRTIAHIMQNTGNRGINLNTLTKLHTYLKSNHRKKVLDEPVIVTTTDRSGSDSEIGAVLG